MAAACGLSLKPRRRDEPTLAQMPNPVSPQPAAFERLIDSWFPLTYVLNNLLLTIRQGALQAYRFNVASGVVQGRAPL